MTDVIFNGCASRGPLGTGEATLVFNNERGELPIDAKEVQVTRRVYRSGEGEYLINRQPCRLRDIRDLLVGTGITTEAYCIIEQGKVDALLQSSPRDRRVIFEEAAGISQFKAKKTASLRRLERVEQNLLRLSDIVDEVESRVRSVRVQAGKARRYRECASRLQQLRTELGLVDWRALTQQIATREDQLATLEHKQEERSDQLTQAELEVRKLEREIDAALQRLRATEAAASATREQIAAHEATIQNQRARQAEVQQEIQRTRQQLAAMSAPPDDADEVHRDPETELRAAEAELAEAAAAWQSWTEKERRLQQHLEASRVAVSQIDGLRGETLRSAGLLESERTALQSKQASIENLRLSTRRQLVELTADLASRANQYAQQERLESELAAKAAACQTSLSAVEGELQHARRELVRADKQHRQLEARHTRLRERMAVLTELEQRLEGLDGGVQEVLRIARREPDGPLGEARGVVADLFHVDVDTAPLVEVALGERAQFVVLSTASRLLELLQREPWKVPGRIGFLRLDTRPPITALDQIDLSSEPGVMGRADRFVETTAELAPLARRLLGRIWLVDRLSTALRLAQSSGRGLEFVTSDGELLAADGTLVVGPRRAVTGMLSRRSELRACNQQVTELEKQLSQQEAIQTRLDQDRLRLEAELASIIAASTELSTRLADHRQQSAGLRGHMERIAHEEQRIADEIGRLEIEWTEVTAALAANDKHALAAEEAATRLQTDLANARDNLTSCEQQHAVALGAVMEHQFARAKCEQRLEMLRHHQQQAERNQQEQNRAISETRERMATLERQLEELDRILLEGRQALAQLYLEKQVHLDELAAYVTADQSFRHGRAQLQAQLEAHRQQLTHLQSQQHKLEVAIARLRHERQSLCERMQDDYDIDLAKAASSQELAVVGGEQQADTELPLPAPGSSHSAAFDRTAAEREIAELRGQLNNIGAVNLEALDELESLEARFGKLSQQYSDLVEAKASLDKIINRINIDSRQLFLTTLELIRGHFQELFRRLFGGGEADIVVDESEDVLDCGIEIVARPPGKEACIISLLSGGEKTLTCVALLLAVFRSKPSPFCVLDEVDAALDEANIGRFVGVLREFLSFTQFVIVTHSKQTMSGGDTLYGVTMEESGVSKRVSVRFDDVSEDGQIKLHGRDSLHRAA
jgi:chromosome segregation protein